MAARKRCEERDFNRRRWMILEKGFDRAYNQKDTALGECLLKWNVREESALARRQKALQRQSDISLGFREQEKKLFAVTRDQAIREPTLLLERTPTAEQYPGYVDIKQPRYMRPLKTRQGKTPEFSTFSVFQAVKKRKRNPWEEAVKETVQFRPTLCPCARLNTEDSEKLLMDWVVVNEKQTKALGLRSDNRSAPIKQVRTGSNPLNLPSRLNSRLHHLAQDFLDELSCSISSGDGGSDELEDHPDVDEGDEVASLAPVFVTQLPHQKTTSHAEELPAKPHPQHPQHPQHQHHHQFHDLMLFEVKDDSKKEKMLAHKHQVDTALTSIYEMLDHRRVTGKPRIRPGHRQQQQQQMDTAATSTASASRVSTASGFMRQHSAGILRTTCRTAESIKILRDARKKASTANDPAGAAFAAAAATEGDTGVAAAEDRI